MAVVTLVGLLSAVCPLVPFHVILLDKFHSTLITAKRLFSYRWDVTGDYKCYAKLLKESFFTFKVIKEF